MQPRYSYTCNNVNKFNELLDELCGLYNCVLMNCFDQFLEHDGYGLTYNRRLYYDWLHLNDIGLGVLASCLKAVVNKGSFNHRFSNFGDWGSFY